jgi:hypothetical protein
MLFTSCEVCTEKIFSLFKLSPLKSTPGLTSGLRPKAEGRFWGQGEMCFFSIRTDLNGK